jgi:hypothetical protein
MKSAAPTQEGHIAQTGKAGGKERTSIKQQNSPVHYRKIVEKGEWTREIPGKPDNASNQDNIEIDLQMNKETKIGDIWQNQSRANRNGVREDKGNRKCIEEMKIPFLIKKMEERRGTQKKR